MKPKENLSHQEIMDGLSMCWKELISHEVSHRNMPNIINRGKAAAQIVTAMHREEIMENKRSQAKMLMRSAERTQLNR